jgi:DNA repair photolyase
MELGETAYNSPRWSWEILDCAMPMTFDTYSNCAHQCLYCFAFFQRAVGNSKAEYLHHKVRSVNVDRVKRMFTDPDKSAGQFGWYIKNKMVLQWGGLSDGFDWYEKKFRKSLELLKFFREIDYPVSISTKGTWFLDDPEYIEAFTDARNVQMKYSIITTDPKAAKKIEAGCPSPAERFRALARLKEMGVGITTVRFRPYVIGMSDLCVEDIFKQSEAAGVDSLTSEFLCLESRSSNTAAERYRLIGEITGFGDGLFRFYKENSSAVAGLLRLNYDLKRPHFERMEALAEKHGIDFYVSDAHHKERSAGAGCCGLPNDGGPLSNINRGQYAEAIQIAKRKGVVYFSDIEPLAQGLKNIPYKTAEGFNQGTSKHRARRHFMNMLDYMKEIWNTPRDPNSPARYFGGAMVPSGVDDEGNVIYLYNKPYTDHGIKVKSVVELTEYLSGVNKDREDGGRFGHVAYPVYVLVGDMDPMLCTAVAELEAARLPYTAFVSPLNLQDFSAAFPSADVLGLPFTENKAEQRQHILDYGRHEKLAAIWFMDADCKNFRFNRDGQDAKGVRAALSGLEQTFTDYGQLALAGLSIVKPGKGAFAGNVGVSRCFLMRTDTEIDFDPQADSLQDTDISIAHLDAGWTTLLSNESRCTAVSPPKAENVAYYLLEKWDLYVSVKTSEHEGKEASVLKVHWTQFTQPLLPSELEKILTARVALAEAIV